MSKSATLAKITRPSLSGILPRERLFSLLDSHREGRVVWITGPPGSGKTTMVASYLEERQPQSLWYQLDRDDADVAALFYFLGAAVSANTKTNGAVLPLFTSEYHSDLSAFTRRYFQKLYQQLGASFVLVLDGYQEIPPQSAFHNVILDAVSEMPSEGCAIIISRSDPPPSMVRLRANRLMDLVSWSDLRLTREETGDIVELWGINLSEDSLQRLYDKTEGWAAGLVLMLDQAESNGTVSRIPALSAPQLIFDYLAGEIFQKFDTSTQDFMLRTAFLCEMTADMAEQLTGRADSGAMLDNLRRNHHFVSLKPGSPAPFYAYHPLLGEFLSARAKEFFNHEECSELMRRSAAVLDAADKAGEAVGLLGQAGDWQGMSRLILEHAPTMLEHGRGETLEKWLEELPEEIFSRDPWFFYWRGACRFAAAPRESRILYERAFQLFQSQPVHNYRGLFFACCGVMDSILYELDDLTLLDRWISVLEGLMESVGSLEQDIEVRVTASMFMSLIMRQPQHPAINDWASRAATVAREMSDPNLRLSVELLVAISATYIGYFSAAKTVIETMRQLCRSPQVTPLSLIALKNVESMYYMFNAKHEECLSNVYDGLGIAETSGIHLWSYHLLGNGVASALGASDLDSARELLGRMENYPKGPLRLDSALFHYYSAWDAMMRADIPSAFRHQKTALERAKQSGCTYFELLCRLAIAQVLTEYGDPAQAAIYLRQVHDLIPQFENRLLSFMFLMIGAYIDFKQNKELTGLAMLQKGLAVGRENGYKHFLWWQPDMMSDLCNRALAVEFEVDYVKGLVRSRGLTPPPAVETAEAWPWLFRVYSLGRFNILKNDKPLGFMAKIQRKPMELLKAIIAFGGEDIPEDRLAHALWPGIDIDYARRSLNTTLHRLRKMLEEDNAVLLQRGRLSLNPSFWWIDAQMLNAVYREIDELRQRSLKGVPVEQLLKKAEKISVLYQGPFMVDEPDQRWIVSLREKMRNKYLRYMGELGRHWEEMEDWDRAVDHYRRGIEVDALTEGFYRHLMLCYLKLDRAAEAIEVYESCRKTLRAVLDSEPSPETRAIYEKLLS